MEITLCEDRESCRNVPDDELGCDTAISQVSHSPTTCSAWLNLPETEVPADIAHGFVMARKLSPPRQGRCIYTEMMLSQNKSDLHQRSCSNLNKVDRRKAAHVISIIRLQRCPKVATQRSSLIDFYTSQSILVDELTLSLSTVAHAN